MKKQQLFLVAMIFLLVFALGFVSAEEGCCRELKNGAWCQTASQDECTTTVAPTSCDSFSPCALGTCIDEQKGNCMPNTPKALCEVEGGFWNPLSKAEIPMCQNGCCSFGDYASFSTQVECKQLASVYGVEVNFRADITDEFSCYALSFPEVKGACLFSGGETTTEGDCSFFQNLIGECDSSTIFGNGRACTVTTKQSCISSGGEFHEDLLCTAPALATDCAKSSNTVCENDRVYFTDTCGNLANIYDEKMYSKIPEQWDEEMENYWTEIQAPSCVHVPGTASCGYCSYIAGSVCKEYKSGEKTMPEKPEYGDNVCSNLECYYDTDGDGEDEIYRHGEAWCAHSEGVYPGVDVFNNNFNFTDPNFKEKNSDYNEYNIPGSRYYKLMCIDGEVLVEPCRDFRNEVCMESTMGPITGDFKIAQCYVNTWRDCFNYTAQDNCEKSLFCEWVPGYRFDGVVATWPDDRNMDVQGSCVPAFSPGFDFWEPGNDGSALCSLASVQEIVAYETNLFTKRENFKDNPLCDLSMTNDAVQRCFRNCYAIPGYGLESPVEGGFTKATTEDYLAINDLIDVHMGVNNALPKKFENYCISDRRGYYCADKTGEVGGNDIKCADTKGNMPVFLTHQEWIDSLRQRARSLGDCGYKPGIAFDISEINKELEVVTALFQITKQDGELKKNTSIEKIYVGDFEYIAGEAGDYRGGEE